MLETKAGQEIQNRAGFKKSIPALSLVTPR
jgi:hypothetical protein